MNRYGRLIVLKEIKRKGERLKYLCKCDCGNTKEILARHVKAEAIKSCGCLQKEASSKASKTHGLGGSYIYNSWKGIKSRCLDKSNKHYKNYGGRGIIIHKEWEDDPVGFADYIKKELGERPPKHTLDRINNEKGYEPGNLRWATSRQQNNNTRKNRHLTLNGETLTVAQWSRKLKVSKNTITKRLRLGWSTERTLTTKH